jgi:hypothetical protein|nr:carboxypeptidase-like regulatory domain-containing protein [Kofleriaceae bacterium]
MGSRVLYASLFIASTAAFACGKHHLPEKPDAGNDAGVPPDACTTLACDVVQCEPKGLPPTTITGTVFAPNGTLPLFGVTVYVPFSDPGALPPGVQCDRCSDDLPGGAIAQTTTDEAGNFTLENVPATSNVPVVIQVGKWRRQLTIPNVAACQTLQVTTADTRLPSSYHDATPLTTLDGSGAPKVDMPMIAISTGDADALECLPLKLGVDPSEITNDVGPGHVHLYTNAKNAKGGGQGAKQFQANWPGSMTPAGDAFGDATVMWGDTAHLGAYDIVMLSCEGGQFPESKPQSSLEALRDYANEGGRVFMSHWHNIWIGGEIGNGSAHGIPEWEALTTWNFNAPQNDASQLAVIDETVDKGSNYAQWMLNVGGSTVRDQVTVDQPRYTLMSAAGSATERMVWVDPAQELASSNPAGETSIQDLQLTTPVDATDDNKCGKVVFSDMHVSSGSTSSTGVPYPNVPPAPNVTGGCSTSDLSPQEKALAFIFFDIATCVGSIQ